MSSGKINSREILAVESSEGFCGVCTTGSEAEGVPGCSGKFIIPNKLMAITLDFILDFPSFHVLFPGARKTLMAKVTDNLTPGLPLPSRWLYKLLAYHSSKAETNRNYTFKIRGICWEESGAPGRSRTSDLVIRSHALYPAELRVQSQGFSIPNPTNEGKQLMEFS